MTNNHKENIKKVYSNDLVSLLIRIGYLTRGLLYGLIGLFCLLLIFGISDTALGTSDVLQFISQLAFGSILIIGVIAGLIGYSLWSLMRAFMDLILVKRRKLKIIHRVGYLFSSISYAVLVFPAVALLTHTYSDNNSKINNVVSDIFSIPYGNLLVILVGLTIIAGGIFQIMKAINAKKPQDLWSEEERDHFRIPFMIFAKIGIAMRGVIFILIGYFCILAGFTTKAAEIKNIEGVLNAVLTIAGGPILLGIIGTGLLFFGAYSAALSIWVDLPE